MNQETLKEQLSYNPETGVFTRNISNNSRYPVGGVAGSRRKDGYVVIQLGKKKYKAHRLAWLYMTGEWPKQDLDHINRVKHDNRIKNLRDIAHQENMANMAKSENVGIYKHGNKWKACVRINNKSQYLGLFTTRAQAIYYRDTFIKSHPSCYSNLSGRP